MENIYQPDLPVLVSVSGSMEKALKENHCGYKYNNGSNLAEIIKNYFNNSEKLVEHSINARQLYEQEYNGDVAYSKMLDYLIEVNKTYADNKERIHDTL